MQDVRPGAVALPSAFHAAVVGDLHEYRLIRSLANLADLEKVTQASDLLTQAFGNAEGSLFFRTGTSAVERVERRIVELRGELSHQAP